MLKTTAERTLVGLATLLICAGAPAPAELHPIVEIQSGYLFGAISDGKWIKADETARLIGDETTYRVYGLTQALGDAHVKRLWRFHSRQNPRMAWSDWRHRGMHYRDNHK